MAKEKKGLSAKEETLNLIIEAQRQKIEALTDYGKKLKKEVKECTQFHSTICKDIEDSYDEHIKELVKTNRIMVAVSIIISALLGMIIGFTI